MNSTLLSTNWWEDIARSCYCLLVLKIPTTLHNLNLILIAQIKLWFYPNFIKRHFIPWLKESQGAENWSFLTLFLKYFIKVPKISVTVLFPFNGTNTFNVVQGFTFIYTKLPKIMTQSARKEMFRKIGNLEMVWNSECLHQEKKEKLLRQYKNWHEKPFCQ